MKRVCCFLAVILAIAAALTGCSKLNETDAKKVAAEFIENVHSVDDAKVDEYRKLEEMILTGADNGKGAAGGIKSEPDEEYMEILKSLDENIQDIMTEEGYEKVVANRFNLLTTSECAEKGYNSSVENIVLGENQYKGYKDVDKVRYPYEATLKVISSDGSKEQKGVLKGQIELLKEDGRIKVSSYVINEYPVFN